MKLILSSVALALASVSTVAAAPANRHECSE